MVNDVVCAEPDVASSSSSTSSCPSSDTTANVISVRTSTKPVEIPMEAKSTRGSKRKKRRRHLSICTTNCRYDIIKKVAQKFGMKEVAESDNWNLYWTDLSISIERCKEMKRFQRINHFPGMLEICRKDLLARNLNRMLKLFPKDYNFFPKTWCLPADLGDALNYSRIRKNKTFILKPDAGSQGKGIFITKTLRDIKPHERMICQVYIARPFLIDGYKFDLRVYTLITTCDPLRIYVYNEGLVRFATSRYKEPTGVNITNVFMHLTNYAVNKHSRTYNCDDEGGSKRKFSWFNNHMRTLGHDVTRLWQRIDDAIIKTVFSALPILRHSYHACFPNHDLVPACCELLGMDILFDRHLSPQLLEVNHSPSFHTDTLLDLEIKENLLSDMFTMLNLDHCDKRKIIREDRRRVQDRLLRGHNKDNEHVPLNERSFVDFHRHELASRGGFRLVYPDPKTEHTYHKFLRQGQASLYSETASSNARHLAAAAIRDEVRAKEEAAKKALSPQKRHVPSPEAILTPIHHAPPTRPSSTCSSFEPQQIIEAEEKERLIMLAHRDFLVKSYGLNDHVYMLLKKNGALRPADERKFNKSRGNLKAVSGAMNGVKSDQTRPIIQNLLDFGQSAQGPIKCDMAQIYSRPHVPAAWKGSNKAHLVRAFSNSVKLHSAQARDERNNDQQKAILLS